jgi:HAD superfamily hydrolase (TIGR01549 family)
MFKYISSLQNITFLKKLRIATKIFSKYLTYAKEAPFYPDAYDFIKKFKKNFDFFIVSHNQTKNILPHLEEKKVKSFFKGIYGADLIHALKPDPNSLSIVFEVYKSCKLNEFVIIGDMPSDIIAGNEAGIWTIAIANGVSNRDVLVEAKPSLLVATFQDLINMIDGKNITDSKNQKSIKINS